MKKVILMKRAPRPTEPDHTSIFLDPAVEALATSVGSIIADDKVTDKAAAMSKTFDQFKTYVKSGGDDDAILSDQAADTATPSKTSSDRISMLADLISEATGGAFDRAASLGWLLHTAQGQSLVLRTAKNQPTKEDPMKLVQAVIKQYGIHAVSKSMIAENRSFGIPEAEFTSLIDAEAQQTRKAGETREQCFARFFTDPANAHLQKAHAIAKNAALMDLSATQVGGAAATDTNPNFSAAMEQLQAMADKLRRESPWLSVAQGFSRVFTDPANAAIAARAHKRPTATTAFAFPR